MIKHGLIKRRTFIAGLAGLSTAVFLPFEKSVAQVSKPFSFAFVSDCHLITRVPDSFKLTQESQLFLQDAIKQINGLSPDFVLFGGDQVDLVGEDEVNWQLFIDIAQSLNCPWSFILGERDVSGAVPVDKLKTYGRDWKGKGLPGETSYWSQDVFPEVHFIGLDTSRANSPTGDLSAEQLKWLEQDLEAHRRGIVIVASHHPLLPPAPYDGGPPWDDYIVPQGASAREILSNSRYVRLALSGHVYVSKIEREKDIWYVSTPGLDVFPCVFRFFRIGSDGIIVETYQVDYPALVKKARNSLASSTLAMHYNSAHPATFLDVAEGSREDQNAQLPFSRNASLEAIKHRNPPKQEAPKPEAGKKKRKSFFKRKNAEESKPPDKTLEKNPGGKGEAKPPAEKPESLNHAPEEKAGQEETPKENTNTDAPDSAGSPAKE